MEIILINFLQYHCCCETSYSVWDNIVTGEKCNIFINSDNKSNK